MDERECLPLFCCGTLPQGGNFHKMCNLTSKLTILECMVKNFKKGLFWGSGFPHSSVGKETAYNAGDPGSYPWVGKSPWRRERLPTLVIWHIEFHGLYSPWGLQSQTRLSDFHFFWRLWCKIGPEKLHSLCTVEWPSFGIGGPQKGPYICSLSE